MLLGMMALQTPLVFNPTHTNCWAGSCLCVLVCLFGSGPPPPDVSPGNAVTGLIKLSSTSHGYVDSSICINDLWCNVTLPAGSDKH